MHATSSIASLIGPSGTASLLVIVRSSGGTLVCRGSSLTCLTRIATCRAVGGSGGIRLRSLLVIAEKNK